MIVLDTNILGTFTRVGALDLLRALFPKDELGVTPAVYSELVAGMREGRQFLQTAVKLVESGELALFALTAEEVVHRVQLPGSLNEGEAQSIAVCQSRGAAFLTNDRRAHNYCISENIEVFDLPPRCATRAVEVGRLHETKGPPTGRRYRGQGRPGHQTQGTDLHKVTGRG